jgi:hypothetical protein
MASIGPGIAMIKVTQSKSGSFWQVVYKGQVVATESNRSRAMKVKDKLEKKYRGILA